MREPWSAAQKQRITDTATPLSAGVGQVCRTANLLKSLGVEKGDNVTIYLPMIPAMPIAMVTTRS